MPASNESAILKWPNVNWFDMIKGDFRIWHFDIPWINLYAKDIIGDVKNPKHRSVNYLGLKWEKQTGKDLVHEHQRKTTTAATVAYNFHRYTEALNIHGIPFVISVKVEQWVSVLVMINREIFLFPTFYGSNPEYWRRMPKTEQTATENKMRKRIQAHFWNWKH